MFFSQTPWLLATDSWLVKPSIELWPLPYSAHFRARREPGTIPLVLTNHPTNALVKKIITRNLHLVRVTVKQQQSFSPYAFYMCIAVIATYVTPLSRASLITLQLSLSGYLYDAFEIREKGTSAKKVKGIVVRKNSDNADGKPACGFSLQHKTFN